MAGMKARLRALELRRGALLVEIEDRTREVNEIERDGRILALAIDEAENPEPDQPESPAEVK